MAFNCIIYWIQIFLHWILWEPKKIINRHKTVNNHISSILFLCVFFLFWPYIFYVNAFPFSWVFLCLALYRRKEIFNVYAHFSNSSMRWENNRQKHTKKASNNDHNSNNNNDNKWSRYSGNIINGPMVRDTSNVHVNKRAKMLFAVLQSSWLL